MTTDPRQQRTPSLMGCVFGLSVLLSLVVTILLWTGVIRGPESWGPKPWGQEASESRELLERLDPAKAPDPEERARAIERIFKLSYPDVIVPAHKKALEDPDKGVRVAAIKALGRCLKNNPKLLVGKNVIGMRVTNKVHLDLILSMGEDDESPEVRKAVAEFWLDQEEFSQEGKEALQKAAAKEKDEHVRQAIQSSLDKLNSH